MCEKKSHHIAIDGKPKALVFGKKIPPDIAIRSQMESLNAAYRTNEETLGSCRLTPEEKQKVENARQFCQGQLAKLVDLNSQI